MSTFRKIIIGFGLLVFVGAGAFGIYYVFFRGAPAEPGPGTNVNAPLGPGGELVPSGPAGERPVVPPAAPGAGLPGASPIARGGLTLSPTLVATPTLGATPGGDGQSVHLYDRQSGRFLKVFADGRVSELSNTAFPDVSEVTWSDDGSHAILEFPDGAKLSYDFNTQRQATIPPSWNDFSFSPDSGSIAAKAMGDTAEQNWLVVSDADGSNATFIEPLGENGGKVRVDWSPTGEVVAMSQTGNESAPGSKEVLFIGANGENFRSLTVRGLGFMPKWSPDGERMLFSAAAPEDDYRPRLWISNARGENIGFGKRSFDLFTTAEKCAFAGTDAIYCAVPDAVPAGAGLSPETLVGVPDTVYRVNLSTGAVTAVGRPDSDTSMERLSVSADGATLFFVDQLNGNLKKMQLR